MHWIANCSIPPVPSMVMSACVMWVPQPKKMRTRSQEDRQITPQEVRWRDGQMRAGSCPARSGAAGDTSPQGIHLPNATKLRRSRLPAWAPHACQTPMQSARSACTQQQCSISIHTIRKSSHASHHDRAHQRITMHNPLMLLGTEKPCTSFKAAGKCMCPCSGAPTFGIGGKCMTFRGKLHLPKVSRSWAQKESSGAKETDSSWRLVQRCSSSASRASCLLLRPPTANMRTSCSNCSTGSVACSSLRPKQHCQRCSP